MVLYLWQATGVRRCLSEKGKRKSGAVLRDGDVSATEATRKCAVSGKMLIKDDKKSGEWRCVVSHRE